MTSFKHLNFQFIDHGDPMGWHLFFADLVGQHSMPSDLLTQILGNSIGNSMVTYWGSALHPQPLVI